MRLQIKREKFINHQCPAIPKNVMDNFYSRFMRSSRNQLDWKNIDVVETINVRVNQAYEGASKFHFYISINGLPEFHMEIYDFEKSVWINQYSRKIDIKKHPRFEWILDCEKCLGVSFGNHNLQKRYDAIWDVIAEKKQTKNRVKKLRSNYEQFKKLSKEFSNY